MGRLEGKVALVTGSARDGGIGRAIVQALAEEGAAVTIHDWQRDDEAEDFAAELREAGHRVFIAMGDVTNIAFCERLIESVVAEFDTIDILVNNAGGALYTKPHEITEAIWDHAIDLHLKAPFFLSRAAARHMQRARYGRIVNISSEQAYIGHPLLSHYTAAKAGLRTLSKSLALAYAPDITVNTVCPGPVLTGLMRDVEGSSFDPDVKPDVPLRRWGQPSEVARSVVFLVTSDGDAYTGQTLDPNVGAVMN